MSDLRPVQRTLQLLNLYPGRPDGILGPLTLAGILAVSAGRPLQNDLRETAAALLAAMIPADILTLPRIAHFIATLSHESAGFSRLQENLHYTDPARLDALFKSVQGVDDARALIRAGAVAIGNRVYAGRLGNGDESSGEGFRYRGRSAAQLTGKNNYLAMGAKLGIDLEKSPDLALDPEIGARICVRFWTDHGCNALADINDSDAIRFRWNGPGMVGAKETRRIADGILKLGAR